MTKSIVEVHAELTAPGQPFEMEELDIRGVRTRVWKNAPPTLRDILIASRAHGDRDYLVMASEHAGEQDPNDRLTFEQHFRRVATLAHRLIDDFGVKPGDRVAIMMRNFPEWVTAFWATTVTGAIVVPLNAWWTPDELEYGIADSGSTVVFADQQRAERIADSFPSLGIDGRVIVARGPSTPSAGTLRFEDVMGRVGDDVALPDVPLGPEDDATIFYTSGTTGRPKGALGTHRNICTNLLSLMFAGARGGLRRPADAPPAKVQEGPNRVLLPVPLFHVTGCHSLLVTNTFIGGTLFMMYRWDPDRALELIESEHLTYFGGVPSMVLQVLNSPKFETADVSSLCNIGYGGAPASRELARRIEAMFPGRTPTNGYGLTETSSLATANSGVDYLLHPESVGAAVAVCDVKIADEKGDPLPSGEIGELWIKGPNIIKGYWNKPEATSTTFTDGWLHTGDVARIDEESFIYIVDRAKDMVIRGGENISCIEVESAIYDNPAVADCAVIGIPHHELGEEVGAVVQLKPGEQLSEDELKAFLGGHLSSFKVPVRIWFSDDALPRNAAGKILKRELREELTGAASTGT
jgi:acyl-CoA synthetase (AMP-forming)/AMP-acid ligase II